MATIARQYTFQDGNTAYGSQVETEFGTLYNAWNNHDAGTSSHTTVKVSGQVLLASGTVSAPGLSFTTETTGFYLASSNTVALSIGGTQSMTFDTTSTAISKSSSGGTINLTCRNTSNTASSHAKCLVECGGSSAADAMYQVSISGGVAFTWGLDNSTTNDNFVISRSTSLGTNDAVVIDGSTGAVAIRGTNTNDSAATGFVGEVQTSTAGVTSAPATTQYGDLASITLSAGHWMISCQGLWVSNGATWTDALFGITTTSGNSGSGLTEGANKSEMSFASTSTTITAFSGVVTPMEVKPTGSTTYYLKFRAVYSAGTPQAYGRITAVRIR